MMICTIILFSYLITCCTHLVTLAKITTSTTPAPIIIHQHHHHIHDHNHLLQSAPLQLLPKHLQQPEANGGPAAKSRDDTQREPASIKVHKLMSEQDLRRTFQVDSHDQVPEYEVLTISNKLDPAQEEQLLASSAYAPHPSLVNQSSNIGDHPVVKLKLSTFGKQFKLRLKRNVDFQQRIKDMKMFMAESTEDGKLRYTEVKQPAGSGGAGGANSPRPKQKRQDDHSAKLLDDLQNQLAHLQANHTTYHDEENLAALLIDHDKRTGRLQLDGTIGNDFVIKPLPEASARALEAAHAKEPRASERTPEVGEGRPEVSHHVVFRQKPTSEESSSEHRHSFMVSPGERMEVSGSMEQIALSFNSERVNKQPEPNEKYQDEDPASNLINDRGEPAELGDLDREESEAEPETDLAHDPLGGQFQLEPGLVNLTASGSWSLVGGGVNSMRKRTSNWGNNSTSNQSHGRFKRHAANRGRGIQQQQPRPAGSQVRRKRQAPDTVWPEVLLVVDYDSFLLHGGDSRDVKRYFVSFWNGVDLRYKLLVHPHIRISLAGMIVAKDRDATPYLERNRLRAPNADAVDAAGALTDMGKYLYREDRLPTYDLAVVITKLDMCRRRYEGGRCNRGTAGFAYVGGACVVNKRLEKVNSVAIIEDSGGFSGIIVAAHEVGHLLGCVHDGSPPPSYLGGPGATHCPWEDGFIMSDLRHTERGFRWSQCSVEQFKHFLNGETATCLYNYPHESQMLHRLSPGTMLSLDEQCKRDRGTNACFKDARVCAQLFCFDSASGYCVSYRPAAEGSPCGEGQVCRNGKCVGEIENIIPDYTHQSQTIVAPGGALVGGAAPSTGSAPIARQLRQSPARLADNGPSASSTSLTATSAPESPAAKLTGAAADAAISSRMDTLPIDLPIDSPPSTPAHPAQPQAAPVRYAGRFSAGGSQKQTSTNSPSASSRPGNLRSSPAPKYSSALDRGNSQQARIQLPLTTSGQHSEGSPSTMVRQTGNYQQRSGHQALPKAIGANINNNKNHYTNNLNDQYQAALAIQSGKQQYYINNNVY